MHQLDAFTDDPAQGHSPVRHQIGQVQHLGLQGLLTREGQQLAYKRGGAQAGAVDRVEVREGRVARQMALQQQFGDTVDHGEKVVEVMRDAAGKLADALIFAVRQVNHPRQDNTTVALVKIS